MNLCKDVVVVRYLLWIKFSLGLELRSTRCHRWCEGWLDLVEGRRTSDACPAILHSTVGSELDLLPVISANNRMWLSLV